MKYINAQLKKWPFIFVLFCTDLLSDNVGAAINCAKRVVRDPSGIEAW